MGSGSRRGPPGRRCTDVWGDPPSRGPAAHARAGCRPSPRSSPWRRPRTATKRRARKTTTPRVSDVALRYRVAPERSSRPGATCHKYPYRNLPGPSPPSRPRKGTSDVRESNVVSKKIPVHSGSARRSRPRRTDDVCNCRQVEMGLVDRGTEEERPLSFSDQDLSRGVKSRGSKSPE